MADFVDRHDLGHVTHLADTSGAVWARFEVFAQPTWVFVDGETGDSETIFGLLGAEGITERLDALGS